MGYEHRSDSQQMGDHYPPAKARDKATLEQQIMDAGIAKNDAEWWARERIDRLQKVLANLVGLCRSGPDKYIDDPMLNAALELAERELAK